MNSPHVDHRKRLKDSAASCIDELDDLTLLELMLTYAIPRRDTRPLAAELLEKYGSLPEIFKADISQLERITGISRHTAVLFMTCAEMSKRMAQTDFDLSFENEKTAGPYLVTCYSGEQREKVLLLTLTSSGRLIGTYTVQEGSINSASFSVRRVTELALRDDAVKVILAHNHPHGPLFPSDADLSTTDRMAKALSVNSIILCQHYIISGGRYITVIGS